MRSRTVAHELKKHSDVELFAGTPPLEYPKLLIACAAGGQKRRDPPCLIIVDVNKAYILCA